jgi:predicted ATPase
VAVLLERHVELEELREMLGATRGREGSLGVVVGEPGIGKTRLLRAAREFALEGGFTVLQAGASELETAVPFGVVHQLLEPYLARLSVAEHEQCFAAAAALARPLFQPERAAAGGDDARLAALHGLYWLVANIADRGPLALLVDDAHWCDAASLRFLDYLGLRLPGLAASVLVATREGGSSGAPGALLTLARRADGRVLHPSRLSEAAVATLVRSSLADDADDRFCRA